MFCPECGTQLPDNAQFCKTCGTRVGAVPAAAVQVVRPAAPVASAAPLEMFSAEQLQWINFTRSVYRDLADNDDYTGAEAVVTFPPRFNTSEKRIARAPFQEYEYSGREYNPDGSPIAAAIFTHASPMAGLAYVGASLFANSKAKKDAQVQWRLDDQGELIVTDYGFYMINNTTPADIWYSSLISGEMIDWDGAQFEADFGGERMKFILKTPVASLVFMLWCLVKYPAHPQLSSVLGL